MISGDNTKRYKKSIKVHNSKGNNKIEQNRANNDECMNLSRPKRISLQYEKRSLSKVAHRSHFLFF